MARQWGLISCPVQRQSGTTHFLEMTKTGTFFSISSARHRNGLQLRSMPKDVVKNWMRSNNAIDFFGLWEVLNNPEFKGVEFDHFKNEAIYNSITRRQTASAIKQNIIKKRGKSTFDA